MLERAHDMGKRRRIPDVDGMPVDETTRLRYRTAEAELDLHGKTVVQARRATRAFLRTQVRLGRQRVVRLITGRGLNSPDGPKLRDAVERELGASSHEVDRWEPSIDGGSYVVKLT
jgi:DNA-nicking Smr family endonuclease